MLMSFGGQMRSEAATAMWNLINKVPVSEHQTAAMFYSDFVPTPGAAVQHERYYSPGHRPGATAPSGATTSSPGTQPLQRRPRTIISDDDDEGINAGNAAGAAACNAGRNTRRRTDNGNETILIDETAAGEGEAAGGSAAAGTCVPGMTGFERVQAVLSTRPAAPQVARTTTTLGDFEPVGDGFYHDNSPAQELSPARDIGPALRGVRRAGHPFVDTEAGHSGSDDDDDDEEVGEDGRREMADFIVEDHDSDAEDMEEANNASGESDHED